MVRDTGSDAMNFERSSGPRRALTATPKKKPKTPTQKLRAATGAAVSERELRAFNKKKK